MRAPARRSSGRSRPPRAPRRARRPGSCRLRLQQRDQRIAVLLEQIGGALERGARSRRRARPKPLALPSRMANARLGARRSRAVDRRARPARLRARATTARAVALHATSPAARRDSRDRRTRRPSNSCAPAIEIARQRNARMARLRWRRAIQSCGRFRIVARPAPPDRPRPTRTTSWRRSPAAGAPDRRAGRDARRPARRRGRRRRLLGEQRLVERLAHAVQALELVAFDAAGLLDHARDGERVVGGELRIETRPRGEQLCARRPCRRDRSSPCG